MAFSQLKSIYSTDSINESITLCEEAQVDIIDKDRLTGKGKIVLEWLPYPRIIIDASINQLVRSTGGVRFEIRMPNIKQSPDFLAFSSKSSIDTSQFRLTPQGPIVTQSADAICRVIFHIANFPYLIGLKNDRLTIQSGKWVVHIDPIPNLKELQESLKRKGGYAITHVAELSRRDSAPFGVEDAQEILEALSFFLTFARGFWAPAILPRGIDDQGNISWEEWKNSRIDSWEYAPSWFDWTSGESLQHLLPGFLKLWQDKSWHRPLKNTVHWYVGANKREGGVDGSVVLTQAALELLAWTQFVDVKGSLSKNGFKQLPAADQLRLLISETGISFEVPNELGDLAALAKEFNWDGPEAFTQLRNSIVHPGHGREERFTANNATFEGWLLGVWYLELVLLHLCDYDAADAAYAKRLIRDRWLGETTPVPWAEA